MTTTTQLTQYSYRGARAMVLLHEKYLREFVQVWKKAKEANLRLPQTDDPNYKSLESLLFHVMRAARNYMTWMCEVLKMPDPAIAMPPSEDRIEREVDTYLGYLLEQWRVPLAAVNEDRFYDHAYKSRWDVEYCVDAMLEHAVMHPIRHQFQLEELLEKK